LSSRFAVELDITGWSGNVRRVLAVVPSVRFHPLRNDLTYLAVGVGANWYWRRFRCLVDAPEDCETRYVASASTALGIGAGTGVRIYRSLAVVVRGRVVQTLGPLGGADPTRREVAIKGILFGIQIR